MSNFVCVGNNKIQSMPTTGNQGDYKLKKLALRLNKPAKINYGNLNMNLSTKLVLTDVNVIQDNATGESPASIIPASANQVEFIADPSDPTNFIEAHIGPNDDKRYTNYTIDPSGQLFGDTECGLDNWKQYLIQSTFIHL